MRLVLLTNIVSPHQLPLAYALADRLGCDNFRYIATEGKHRERTKLGWQMGGLPLWVLSPAKSETERAEADNWCEETDVLLCGLRELDLFRRRAERGLKTLYMSERWFKPPVGFLRMLHPGYWRMARECRMLQRQGAITYLPKGLHAAQDMARVSGLLSGNLRCLFRQPQLKMTSRAPLAAFAPSGSSAGANELPNMRLWGYFVEPGESGRKEVRECGNADVRTCGRAEAGQRSEVGDRRSDDGKRLCRGQRSAAAKGYGEPQEVGDRASMLHVLWLGRMLDWKRVDTLVNAVVRLLNDGFAVRLEIVGYGPEEEKLRRLAGRHLLAEDSPSNVPGILFKDPVPIQEVRGLMRKADTVVLSSDGGEGWGAVVNEAMAEGRCVVGTHEAGSSATMIEHGVNGFLYHAGNVDELAELLHRCDQATVHACGEKAHETLATVWSAEYAAHRLLEFVSQGR